MPGTPPRLIAGGVPGGRKSSRVVASAAWKGAGTLELMLRYIETPHHDTITCQFVGDSVTISFLSSIVKMRAPAKDARPVLIGKMTI